MTDSKHRVTNGRGAIRSIDLANLSSYILLMKSYSVHQAKSQLSKLIQKALQGEEIVITNRHKPVVRLSVIQQPKRKLGFLGHGVWMSNDFNKPLNDFHPYQ
jgi:antitoxin (DNA-binding transcriptional repressor) of toxin-antitoxin stability system